ncbi:MAG: DnaA regulatory inactivator Hda [Spongiibacteraceae bacterium]
MREQLLLFRPRTDASFSNFFVAAANETVIHALRDWLRRGTGLFYLHGVAQCGRSHLLQAVCREVDAIYLPLAELREQDPVQVLDALENIPIICLDDVQAVIDDADWCEQLFHLFNRCIENGTRLLMSADRASANLSCALPDLQSRLQTGGDFRLQALSDDDLVLALQLRARERGIELGDEVASYILTRQARAFPALLLLLDRLDTQSLAEKKRITIPFIKSVIEK